MTSSSCIHAAAPAQAYFVCPVEGRAKYCSAQVPGKVREARRLRTAVLCSALNRADKVRLRWSRSVKTRRGHHRMKIGSPGPRLTSDRTAPPGYIRGLSTAFQNAVDKPPMLNLAEICTRAMFFFSVCHGRHCELYKDPCVNISCQNGGTCESEGLNATCACVSGFMGRHCELYKDPCVNISCHNGGTCESEGMNATCVCASGFIGEECEIDVNECDSNPCHHAGTCVDQPNGYICHCPHGWVGASCEIHLQWKAGHMAESLTNMPRHSLYIIIGALCVAFVLMLIILIVGICRISRIEYQGSARPAYEEFYNCRSIDSEFSSAIASIRHARFGKKSRPAMYDATPVTYEDYSPDDKPLVTLIKTKDL
ncbi:unnamed protein product [Ranitomeya imitator]|uniref:EGF-like domain-containing protein n=1 Tax=Ranitomeya imitator TaxID=111125 RepID=A0ABN9MJ21_9NEOB|nr:unnamed protein product [Ranitomeya imitator]